MTDNTPAYPAGWYADTTAPGTERYYDGVAWTAQTRTAITAPPEIPVTSAAPVATAPWYKRKGIVIPVGIVAGLIVIGSISAAIGGGKGDVTAAPDTKPSASAAAVTEEAAVVDVTVPVTTGLTAKEAAALIENAGLTVEFSADKGVVLDRDNWTVLSSTPVAGATAKAGDTVVVNVEKTAAAAAAPAEEAEEPEAPEVPAMTTAQSSAVRSAGSYLSFTSFSRFGLTEQLTSEYGEGFTPEDAEFAIAYLESTGAVDWNQEAAESAKSYLDISGFSHDGLYEQLTSEYGEGFTPDQANFGLAAVGL
ncbi:MAG: Ltp family lipoprotein [Beijerinckiaceae bacterium]|nr:Ltp family lipoprotein [Beijerinckiaceae bacterium]